MEYRPGVNGFYSLKENARPIYADGKVEHGPLKAGDEILVQVERSAVKTKDAVLTSNLTLTGADGGSECREKFPWNFREDPE